MEDAPHFTVLQGKQLSVGTVLATWSPAAMDLLAVLTEDNMITLYRLDLQRAWVACPDVPVTALSWTPDGGWSSRGMEGHGQWYDGTSAEGFYALDPSM